MRTFLCLFMCALLCQPASAQKQVFSYPFEFEKSFLQKSDYEAYFLQDGNADRFAFILKDNKKVEYVQVDKTFKVLSTVKSDIDNTVFDITEDYLGGTSENGVFNFVYKVSDKKAFSREKIYYQVESVNFNSPEPPFCSLVICCHSLPFWHNRPEIWRRSADKKAATE